MGFASLVRGVTTDCNRYTSTENAQTNGRAVAVLGAVLIAFMAWHIIGWVSFLCSCKETKFKYIPKWFYNKSRSCHLAGDNTSYQVLSAGVVATVAATLCYTQPQTVAAQVLALAAFSTAAAWTFTEFRFQAVGQLFPVASLVIYAGVLWALADQKQWQATHQPQSYLLTAAICLGATLLIWVVTSLGCRDGLEQYDTLASASMPDAVWLEGSSAILAHRTRLLVHSSSCCIKTLAGARTVLILLSVIVCACVTGVRCGINARGASAYNSSKRGQDENIDHFWYTASAILSTVAHFVMAISAFLMGFMIFMAPADKVPNVAPANNAVPPAHHAVDVGAPASNGAAPACRC